VKKDVLVVDFVKKSVLQIVLEWKLELMKILEKKLWNIQLNMGRCIFCGYCAEVCPELAIVHGGRYENSSEQRAHFSLKEDILTSANGLGAQLNLMDMVRCHQMQIKKSKKHHYHTKEIECLKL
jgi:formate hydrogenlyase subunit 6/NADH:ubiquinone oxidoreductase subunit I